jgi:hypothetical protein
LTYALQQGAGRVAGDLLVGGAYSVTAAFARWMEAS